MSFLLYLCVLLLPQDGFPPTQNTLPSKVTLPQNTLPDVIPYAPVPAPTPVRPRPAPPKPIAKPVVPARRVTGEPQHSHRCGQCGYVWSHGSSSFGNAKAHTCPKCGAGPWWNQYQGGAGIRPQMRPPMTMTSPVRSPAPRGRANCPT